MLTNLAKTAAACSGKTLRCSLPNARCPAFPLQNWESLDLYLWAVQTDQSKQPKQGKSPNSCPAEFIAWRGYTWTHLKISEACQDAFLTPFRTDFTAQFALPAAWLVKRKQMAYQTTQRSNMVTSKTFISLGKGTQRLLFRISPSPCYPLLSYIIFLAWTVILQLPTA